ncbi:unnamed protein product [Rotaria sp. Silwood2]|nr:unnamed protein product [Rotaria sp. Silwood2]
MWTRYSQWILLSPKSSSLPYLRLIQQFRTQISRNSLQPKSRRSIKNFDESNILRVELQTETHRSRLLIRPTIFTISFVGCSFVACAIWQYESHRNKLRKIKERWQLKDKPQQISSQLKNIWRDISESKRVIGTIIGLNLIVFLAWRVKRFEPFLLKYFTSSPYKRVISSWLSYVFKIVTRTPNISLGASGSIMALLGAICTQFPDAQLAIIFLPFFTFSAKSALISMVSFDLFGTIMRWRYLDHSAHLGGVLFGIFYVKYGYKLMWESLTSVVQRWHQLREKFK